MSAVAPTPRQKMRLGIFIPSGLLLLVVAAWSAYWFIASSGIQSAIETWREDMVRQGASLACESESHGGYPFRLEFTCSAPTFQFASGTDTVSAQAHRLTAVAQTYDASRIIIEVETPVAFLATPESGGPRFFVDDGTVRASLQMAANRLQQLSVFLPAWRADVPSGGGEMLALAAQSGELHSRSRPESNALDLAVSAKTVIATPAPSSIPYEIMAAKIVAIIDKPQSVSPDTMSSLIARWRDAGGVADIKSVTFDGPQLAGEGTGSVHLDPTGNLEGAFTLRLAKLDKFAAALVERGVISDNDADLLAGAAGLFAQTINGHKAVTLPVRFRSGEIWLGPVKLATLPPIE